MKLYRTLFGLSFAFLAAGCAKPNIDGRLNTSYANVTGIVKTEPAAPGGLVFVNFDDLAIENGTPVFLGVRLSPRKPESMKISVSKSSAHARFDVFLATGENIPYDHSSGTIREFPDGKPIFHIDSRTGVVLVGGTCPAGETDWVAAGSEGTRIALEVVDTTLCRVYLIEQSTPRPIWFKTPSSSPQPGTTINPGRPPLTLGTYYSIDYQGNFDGPWNIDGTNGPAVNYKPMIDELVRQANLAACSH